MKKYCFTGSLVIMFLTLGWGQSEVVEKQVRDLARRKFQWMINVRIDSLGAILDDRLKFIHSNGFVQTKNDVLKDLTSGKLTYKKIVISEMEVRIYDGCAVVTGKGVFEGNLGTQMFRVELLFTEMYVIKNKNWRLVSRHANRLP